MRTILMALPLFAAMLLAACAHLEPSFQGDRMRDTWGNASDRRYVRVRGIGTPPKSVTGTVRRRAASRQAALVEARKELLSIVGGTRMTGGITVRDALVIDSELRESVDRLVFGAEEARIEWDSEDSCVETLQVRRAEVEKIIEGIKPKDLPPPLPEPIRKIWRSEREREDAGSPTPASRRLSPGEAFGMGLLFPGLGQVMAGRSMGDTQDAADLRGRGWATMLITVAVGGLGAGLVTDPGPTEADKYQQGEEANSGASRSTKRGIGYVLIGFAGLLDLWGAFDAKSSLERPVSVGVGPDGARARYSWRF